MRLPYPSLCVLPFASRPYSIVILQFSLSCYGLPANSCFTLSDLNPCIIFLYLNEFGMVHTRFPLYCVHARALRLGRYHESGTWRDTTESILGAVLARERQWQCWFEPCQNCLSACQMWTGPLKLKRV
jgi:hypothetical protein